MDWCSASSRIYLCKPQKIVFLILLILAICICFIQISKRGEILRPCVVGSLERSSRVPEEVSFSNQDCEAIYSMQKERKEIFVPEEEKLNGYIIYDCSRLHNGPCGGWCDRLSGILDTFVMSIITRRHFKIYHDIPCSLESYFEPNKLDWRYKIDPMTSTEDYMYLIDAHSEVIWNAVVTDHLEEVLKTNVTFIRINWDLTQMFRKRDHITEQIPWITKLHYADIYFQVFHYLFNTSQTILRAYSETHKQRKNRFLACAHVRNGDKGSIVKNFSKIWQFLANLNSSKYDIFIASDSDSVRLDANALLEGHNVLVNTGRIGNIDKTNYNCEVFQTSMLDFYTLTQCDILVLTDSGFGMVAAYVRHKSDGLYCYAESNGVFPCSRYTLENIYQGNFLVPGS